jgi:hypothetical protein
MFKTLRRNRLGLSTSARLLVLFEISHIEIDTCTYSCDVKAVASVTAAIDLRDPLPRHICPSPSKSEDMIASPWSIPTTPLFKLHIVPIGFLLPHLIDHFIKYAFMNERHRLAGIKIRLIIN